MKTMVVYGSRSGNTKLVAEGIAQAMARFGPVTLQRAEDARYEPDTELLIVGGPTEGHGLTPPLREFLDRVDGLAGVHAAAFDTRLRWPLWLSGSAAKQIAVGLREAGARLVAAPESFLVTMEPKLCPGEIERAERWATALEAKVPSAVPA